METLPLAIPLAYIVTIFFITLGPVKLIIPFAQLTAKADPAVTRSIALRSFMISTITVVIVAVTGAILFEKWQVSSGALHLTGGLVFLVFALYGMHRVFRSPEKAGAPDNPTRALAVTPLTVPQTVTPPGIAALVVFTGDMVMTGKLVVVLLVIMVLNLIHMIAARWILNVIGVAAVQIAGWVLAVLQAALSIQIMIWGLQLLGAFPMTQT